MLNRIEISKNISKIEAGKAQDVLSAFSNLESQNIRIGITGNSGNGKSTLLANLLNYYIKENIDVAALLVDPSSKINQGSLLADRAIISSIINNKDSNYPFIRSYALRNEFNNLNIVIEQITRYLNTLYKRTFLETSGASQSDYLTNLINDITILTISAHSGNELQFIKSGVIEQCSLIVITKSDLDKNFVKQIKTSKPIITVTNQDSNSYLEVNNYLENYIKNNLETIINKRLEKENLWILEILKYQLGNLNFNKNNYLEALENLKNKSIEEKINFLINNQN